MQGADLTSRSYSERRTALEALFDERGLSAPFTLCPSTTDPATARAWLEWTTAGLEGLCFKRLTEPYRGGARTWGKYKVRTTADAIVGAITGLPAAPLVCCSGGTTTGARCATPAAPHQLLALWRPLSRKP
ncbi:ATP-dependent DNA ligase [Streptomyces sp. NPDC055752]